MNARLTRRGFLQATGGTVALTLLNLRFSPVAQGAVDADRAAGIHKVIWDGRNDARTAAAAGIYFYQLRVNGQKQTRHVVLIR